MRFGGYAVFVEDVKASKVVGGDERKEEDVWRHPARSLPENYLQLPWEPKLATVDSDALLSPPKHVLPPSSSLYRYLPRPRRSQSCSTVRVVWRLVVVGRGLSGLHRRIGTRHEYLWRLDEEIVFPQATRTECKGRNDATTMRRREGIVGTRQGISRDCRRTPASPARS